MPTFPAPVDTNVLFGFHLNDVILGMAERGLFRALWSEEILTEVCERRTRRAPTQQDVGLLARAVDAAERIDGDLVPSREIHSGR